MWNQLAEVNPGGPRSAGVWRWMLLAGEADGATGSRVGIPAVFTSGAGARARFVGAAFPIVGYCGQWLGAVNAGVLRAAWIMRASIASDITQWCVPLRRQQAGNDASSPSKAAASGARPKRRTNRMERARRISHSYYMNFGVPGIRESVYRSGIIDASQLPAFWLKG